tara:strand:+ start:117 stop:515 length:399 start_codon:yes stop_codon:yes gene_type:complete
MRVEKWATTLALVGTRDERFALPTALIEHMQRLVIKERKERKALITRAINMKRWRIMHAHPWLVKVNEFTTKFMPVYDDALFNIDWFREVFPGATYTRSYGPGFYGADQVGITMHNSNWTGFVEAIKGEVTL